MNIRRNDWWVKPNALPIDLSKNVHYDRILNNTVKSLVKDIDWVNNYPIEYDLYESISNYYNVPIKQLAIGYGATDLIQRSITTLKYNKLVIVSPTFEMVEIYCQLNNIEYTKITVDEIENHTNNNDALYIANPNGLSGKITNIKLYITKFKYIIADEVYGDFDFSESLLTSPKNNIIIIKSLSKSLGLAGFRVGFSVANETITTMLQMHRMNYISNTFATCIIPKIIGLTRDVINRMEKTKSYLSANFECVPTSTNFVLFKESNKYTNIFGYRLVNGLYRMALADMETLHEVN